MTYAQDRALLQTRLDDEAGRMLALRRYNILGSGRERNFELITSLVRDLLKVPICAISLLEDHRVWFKSVQGLDEDGAPRSVAFCDHALRSQGCFTVADLAKDERFARNPLVTGPLGLRSYAGAPLVTPDGYGIGALCVMDKLPHAFTEEELDVLKRFADLVVEQMELRTLACQDYLTGSLARRAFVDALQGAMRHFSRDGRPLSLISFDLDHFKAINDRFGHAAGDRVLKAVVDACRSQLRPRDLLGRLGGEEFAVLVTDATADIAMHCAERLRRSVAALDLGEYGPVTASFGIATLTYDMELDGWLEQADAALYAAKRAGRNRCETAADPVKEAA